MALTQDELFKLDLYDLLGLEVHCSLQDVKRAFRKKALKCHPDKNPDDPNAAQLFHQLSCALEILSDESARAAYDKVLNARKNARIRNQQLDSKRRKLKEDLEERERNATKVSSRFSNDELKLKEEVERLRKEGSRLLQEEIKKVREQVNSSWNCESNVDDSNCDGGKCLTVRWQVEKGDTDNGGYTYSLLHSILSKCGKISALVMSPKKRGRAIVEFKTSDAADTALNSELGVLNNLLIIENVGNSTKKHSSTAHTPFPEEPKISSVFPQVSTSNNDRVGNVTSSELRFGNNSYQLSDDKHENDVLARLRQMQRMKRAAEEKTDGGIL